MNAEQKHLQPDDLHALALQLAAFTDLLEQRGDHAVQQTHQAAHQLDQAAKSVAATSERMTAAAIEQFRQVAASVVAEGMHQPMQQAGQAMQSSTQRMQAATGELEARVRVAGQVLAAGAWKTFVASAVASLAVIGVAIYMGMRTHQDIARAEWTGLINAATANGKLAQCREGGLCAHVGNRWIRIDQ